VVRIGVPNYGGTTFRKLFVGGSYYFANTGTGNQAVLSFGGAWNNTAAINRITILPSAGNFIAGSR